MLTAKETIETLFYGGLINFNGVIRRINSTTGKLEYWSSDDYGAWVISISPTYLNGRASLVSKSTAEGKGIPEADMAKSVFSQGQVDLF